MTSRSVRTGRAWAAPAASLVLLASLAGAVHAQGAMPGAAGACTTCHGQQGISQVPDAPNLAGQPDRYLREQLQAYRSGKRAHEVMNVVAKNLSDADIAAVSAYFSAFQIQLKPGSN